MVATAGLLVLVAFVLSVIAVIASVTQRRQVSMLEKQGIQSAVQPDAAVDGPQAFESAVAASREARRARLSRAVRIRKILTPIAFGLSGVIVVLALAARFLAGDREAAAVCAMIAAVSLSFTTMAFVSAEHARQKAAQSALQVDP